MDTQWAPLRYKYINVIIQKKYPGLVGKPAKHIQINGKETVVLKSSEVNTNLRNYHGIASKPANHVMIDGQETIFVEKDQYVSFIANYTGIKEMPSNYVNIDGKVVVVVPINSQDITDVLTTTDVKIKDDSGRNKKPSTVKTQLKIINTKTTKQN